METKSLGFIGGGRITRIFLKAFRNKELKFEKILVFDTNKDIIGQLKEQFPEIQKAESIEQAAAQSIVFIALHPPIIMEILNTMTEAITQESIIISLAPKITIQRIASKLNTGNIMRMVPNATSYINRGFNPVTFGENFSENDKPEIINLISLLGESFEVAEPKLEAYAILSAMLPTYFWFQWNELVKVGTQIGLTEEESKASVQHTIEAANQLLFQSGLTSDQVIDLIPVKPIAEHEAQIKEMYQSKLTGLYEKIKP